MTLGRILGTACAVELIAGCAASQQARDVETSGFLGSDYGLLREGQENEALLVYRNPSANWAAYDKIKLDPVTIWAGEGSEFEDFSQPDRQALADTFYTMLVDELSKDFQLVEVLGPPGVACPGGDHRRADLEPDHGHDLERRAAGAAHLGGQRGF